MIKTMYKIIPIGDFAKYQSFCVQKAVEQCRTSIDGKHIVVKCKLDFHKNNKEYQGAKPWMTHDEITKALSSPLWTSPEI